jgi:hypothetical protein
MIQSLYTILFEKNNRCFIYNSLLNFLQKFQKIYTLSCLIGHIHLCPTVLLKN